MGELASRGQLRSSLLRWALVTVPVIELLGLLSAALSGSGDDGGWYMSLAKPAATPPGWLFPVAWTILYALMGVALAIVLNARGARGRRFALGLFALQLALNLLWSPVFFGWHELWGALAVLGLMVLAALATTLAFGRIRAAAAWLLVPYLAWGCFAGAVNARIAVGNPHAAALAPGAASAQIVG